MEVNYQDSDAAVFTSSFSDFPEDVQLCILSFLDPSELSSFACTSKKYVSLYRDDQRLWFSMCDRRWGSSTRVNRWGQGKISYKVLYRVLSEYENLIGFWRRCGVNIAAPVNSNSSPAPLVYFEWGPFYITGSRISLSTNGSYEVIKSPFLWASISSKGDPVSYLDPEGRFEFTDDLLMDSEKLGVLESELIQVNVSFVGKCHVVLEGNLGSLGWSMRVGNVRGDEYQNVSGSPPDRLMSEIYQYLANKTSPGGNGVSRRQRRREKEKQERMRKWVPEYFFKIIHSSPTLARPLQGLWKGISDDATVDFYLVSYDDIGGIACRKVGESSRPLACHAPVFWTSSTAFIKPPFSPEEEDIYSKCFQSRPPLICSDNGAVSRMLPINSSYDLVIPDLAGPTTNPRQCEGRIWLYENGTFGFGFLRDNYIVDLKNVARNGVLLDTIEPCID